MFSKLNFKIYIAFFLAFAFVIRLLLVNASLANSISLLNNSQFLDTERVEVETLKSNTSTFAVKESSVKYQIIEMCEEELDAEDELYKANTPAVLVIFYTLFSVVDITIKKVVPFDYIKCELQPKRYLSLSVIRI